MRESDIKWPEGLKKTKQREQVIRVLAGAERPMSAMDICVEIEKTGNNAWLSTVYRILESFDKAGTVSRIALPNGDMAMYELRGVGHRHFAMCVQCHKIIPIQNCPIEHYAPTLSEEGFQVTGHSVEFYGQCRACIERGEKTK